MTESEFNAALIAAAFRLAADEGWQRVTVSAACRAPRQLVVQPRGKLPRQ
jgi:hypothetical protein